MVEPGNGWSSPAALVHGRERHEHGEPTINDYSPTPFSVALTTLVALLRWHHFGGITSVASLWWHYIIVCMIVAHLLEQTARHGSDTQPTCRYSRLICCMFVCCIQQAQLLIPGSEQVVETASRSEQAKLVPRHLQAGQAGDE